LLPPDEGRKRAADLADLVARQEDLPATTVPELAGLRARAVPEMFYLIDVRSEAEYEAGHIPGSLNVPGGQAVQRADDFVAVRSAPIVFVSDEGSRATMAAYWYRRMGFPKATVLRGGLNSWRESGQETAVGAPRRPPYGYETARRSVLFVEPRELQRQLPSGRATVVDVGTSVEYQAAHVPGAKWISRGWLEPRFPNLFPDRAATFVVTCPSGHGSVLAAETLQRMGYREIAVLNGGLQSWKEAGLPVDQGLSECLVEANDVVLSPSIRGDREAMRRYLEWEVNLKDRQRQR
jgi:rhodanese-related sulfurtransferase